MWYFDPPPVIKAPPYLIAVNFELTSACNLQCHGCGRTIGMDRGAWHNRHLTKAEFEEIVAHMPRVRTALLQGIGEPTLNPDFLDICRLARESNKFDELIFFTNALVRDADYYEEAARYVDYFIISIDTLNPHFVSATRAGTDTDKLKEMVRQLLAKSLKFEISMVVSRFNAADLLSTLKILNDIGPLLVRFQLYESPPEDRPEGILTREEYELLQQAVERMRVFLPNIEPIFAPTPVEAPENHFPCGVGAPALAPFVTSRGHLTPCCRITDGAAFGNASLVENTFEEIWDSETVRRYVHGFLERGDPACRACYQSRRTILTEPQAAADPFKAVELILVPSVNFAMRLGQKDAAMDMIEAFLGTVCRHPGEAYNKGQALYRISTIFFQLDRRDRALATLDEITALIGPNAQVDEVRAAMDAAPIPA